MDANVVFIFYKTNKRKTFTTEKFANLSSSGFCDILLAMGKVRSRQNAEHYCQSYGAASAPERLFLIEIYWR